MERVNQEIAGDFQDLVQDGRISVVSSGYTEDFQATIYSIIADELEARIGPFLLLLERLTTSGRAESIIVTQNRSRGKEVPCWFGCTKAIPSR